MSNGIPMPMENLGCIPGSTSQFCATHGDTLTSHFDWRVLSNVSKIENGCSYGSVNKAVFCGGTEGVYTASLRDKTTPERAAQSIHRFCWVYPTTRDDRDGPLFSRALESWFILGKSFPNSPTFQISELL